jgi:hypothetical protein
MVALAIGTFIYTGILAGLRQWQRLGLAVLLLDAVLVMYLVLRGLVLH